MILSEVLKEVKGTICIYGRTTVFGREVNTQLCYGESLNDTVTEYCLSDNIVCEVSSDDDVTNIYITEEKGYATRKIRFDKRPDVVRIVDIENNIQVDYEFRGANLISDFDMDKYNNKVLEISAVKIPE